MIFPAIVFLAALALGGCSTILAPDYSLHAVKVIDSARFHTDISGCMKEADAYNPGFDFADVGAQGIEGAANNASEVLAMPLAPAIGAAGGIISGATSGLGLSRADKRGVFLNCVNSETAADKSARVYDPR